MLGAKVRSGALTVEASDFALPALWCRAPTGLEYPLWRQTLGIVGAGGRGRSQVRTVAATAASAGTVRRVRDDIGGTLARDFVWEYRTKRRHLRQYAALRRGSPYKLCRENQEA